MAKKLIDHEEAARMLGVSADELNSMRDRKQIFPKRDAGVWKYEQDQIERLIEERKGGGGSWSDSLELDDLSLDTDPSSIVLSDDSGAGEGHSTKVGKGKLADPMSSDVKLVPDPSGSDVQLVSGSSLKLEKPKPGGSGLLDDIGGPKSEGDKLLGSSSLKLADDEIRLTESDSDRKKKTGSDTRKGDSALKMAAEDDELVLDSKPDSDITVGGGDSGISLVDPHDSGLSLEQPLELEGSNLESFDLGEEDVISLDEDVAADDATHLKTEDDFLLTPVEDATDDTDSGSQVIALEADEEFGGGFAAAPGLEEDLGAAAPLVAPGLSPAAMAGSPALMPAGYVAEPPFSAWNIVALVACFFFLFVGGMFMYDLIRHMWSWDAPYGFTSSMMDSLVKMLG